MRDKHSLLRPPSLHVPSAIPVLVTIFTRTTSIKNVLFITHSFDVDINPANLKKPMIDSNPWNTKDLWSNIRLPVLLDDVFSIYDIRPMIDIHTRDQRWAAPGVCHSNSTSFYKFNSNSTPAPYQAKSTPLQLHSSIETFNSNSIPTPVENSSTPELTPTPEYELPISPRDPPNTESE